jgi:hypothetical protein
MKLKGYKEDIIANSGSCRGIIIYFRLRPQGYVGSEFYQQKPGDQPAGGTGDKNPGED